MQTRAIVEIRFGRLQGKKATIAPGGRLKVGRTDWADFVVPHDLQMSGEHFELTWDGRRCWLKDLGSAKGTLLGGEPVKEGEVEHGGWIRAGQTDFLVHVEAHTPPREDEDDADEEEDQTVRAREAEAHTARHAAAERALESLQAEAEKAPLYAVLDAARTDRILELLRQNVEEYRSLYEGTEGETLAHVAPYLVGPMRRDSQLLAALTREGWGKQWGIYLTCQQPFNEVRKHLRRFLMVMNEQTEERMYFRFYDPLVLQLFLPTCAPRQKAQFFGEIGTFLVETKDGEVMQFRVGEGTAVPAARVQLASNLEIEE